MVSGEKRAASFRPSGHPLPSSCNSSLPAPTHGPIDVPLPSRVGGGEDRAEPEARKQMRPELAAPLEEWHWGLAGTPSLLPPSPPLGSASVICSPKSLQAEEAIEG